LTGSAEGGVLRAPVDRPKLGVGRTIDSMTDSSELVAVDLTEDERDFIQQTLEEWEATAADKPFPFQVLGLSTWEDFGRLTFRLERAVADGQPLTDLDWARVLFLTEVTFASSLIGSGLDFDIVTRFSDSEGISVLRGLQRKIGSLDRAQLLFPNGGRTRTAAEIEEIERWAEKVRREQQGRQYPPGL
jgi:hypothetical protein